MQNYIAAAIGGALGSVIRVFLTKILPVALYGIPLPILCINVIGSFLMGFFAEYIALSLMPPDYIRYFLLSGLLGGFTTFSAFSLDVGNLVQKNELFSAFSYVLLTIALSLIFFFIGFKIARLL